MALSTRAARMQGRVTHSLAFWFWMLAKLPAALWCGVRLHRLDEMGCTTSVPYGWRSQNPFRSTYFAAQAMAAELSTGALVLLAVEDAGMPISTLILDIHGTFGKKATRRVTFRCDAGAEIFAAVAEARATGEARVVSVETVGTMDDGTETSRFRFTWSMKAKQR